MTFAYNAASQLTDMRRYSSNFVIPSNLEVDTRKTYDLAGRTISITHGKDGKVEIAAGQSWTDTSSPPASLNQFPKQFPPDNSWKELPNGKDLYHRRFPTENVHKFLGNNGHWEAVFDENGNLIATPEHVGTYNYGDGDGIIHHGLSDVVPYWFFGKCPEDTTPFLDRVGGPGTAQRLTPRLPNDRDLERIIESIIGRPVFPR